MEWDIDSRSTMIKVKNFFKKLGSKFSIVVKVFKSRSISTQLIFTIILIFMSFFVLQSILNIGFFRNFYTNQEFERVNSDIMEYVTNMNEADSDYYDEMYKFTTENNAYSVIVTNQFRMLSSSFTDYSLSVLDSTTNETYDILVPNVEYNYTLNDILTVTMYEYNENDVLYSAAIIIDDSGEIYNSNIDCAEETCITTTGVITELHKPDSLNYLFDENLIVQREISKLFNESVIYGHFEYETGGVKGYWYKSTDGPVDTLVFVHDLKRWNKIVTIVPIVDTSDIIDIVSSYNYYVYATAIVIILIWSFRLSSIISKPIQNIELVARQIAELNFNVEAHEYNNRENESLSRSINLMARNLKKTLETINTKNRELTEIYEEQSKQVTLKKQLVSSISHELKTPLMIMQVTIQGILDEIIPAEDQEKELNNVLDEISKSSMMIQDMLQIYRLDDANTQLEICEFDMGETVRFFVNDFENAIKKYNLDVDLNIQDDVIVEADLKLVKRVISNFMTNAIKYTPINGKLYIEVSDFKDRIYFELTNYGTSIKAEEIDKIWLPFYRIEIEDSNPLKTKGSGIGLYLVSEILKAHHAEFGIENVRNGVKAYFYMNKKVE